MRRWIPALVLAALLAVGLTSFIYVLTKQGDGAAVLARQHAAAALAPAPAKQSVRAPRTRA